jgi:biotin transporter BioY
MSYPVAAFVAGYLAERGFDRRYTTFVLAMAAGLSLVFAGGVAWLTVIQPVHSVGAALAAGFYPFVLADLVKLFVAASVMPALWRQQNVSKFP